MTHDEVRALARRYGLRMCDENGETHGEELYCFDLWEIQQMLIDAFEEMKGKDSATN